MSQKLAFSAHVRHSLVSHHSEIIKDRDGIRGAPPDRLGRMPTIEGLADLGGMIRSLADYTIALWRSDPEQASNRPTLIVATPRNSEHCRWMGDILVGNLSRDNNITVTKHELAELNSIDPPLVKQPTHTLDREARLRVERFTDEFSMWEAGVGTMMPDPRAVGDTRSPLDHLRRAARGQHIIAGMTMAHAAVQILTSTGGYLANAVLAPDAEEALATGVFPATPTKYGFAHIYEYPPLELRPIRITSEPVQLRHLVAPQPLAPFGTLSEGLPNVPFA